MKGLRKTVYGGAAAAIGLFVTGLISYVVEHGELPPWSSNVLSWLFGLMMTQTARPVWVHLLFVVVPFLIFCFLIYYVANRHNALVDSYDELDRKFGIAEAARAKLEEDYTELEADNAKLLDENSILKVQNQSIPTDRPSQAELTERHVSILLLIAKCENANVITTIENLLAQSELTKVALNSTLDDLVDSGYVLAISMGLKYQLTSSGRKLVLSKG